MSQSDTVRLTPIDMASLDRDEMDLRNQHAVLVPFGKHTFNDRVIYGPLAGVIVWATKRFELIENRVHLRQDPGFKLDYNHPSGHSEAGRITLHESR